MFIPVALAALSFHIFKFCTLYYFKQWLQYNTFSCKSRRDIMHFYFSNSQLNWSAGDWSDWTPPWARATISTVMHFCLAMQFFCRSVVVRQWYTKIKKVTPWKTFRSQRSLICHHHVETLDYRRFSRQTRNFAVAFFFKNMRKIPQRCSPPVVAY